MLSSSSTKKSIRAHEKTEEDESIHPRAREGSKEPKWRESSTDGKESDSAQLKGGGTEPDRTLSLTDSAVQPSKVQEQR